VLPFDDVMRRVQCGIDPPGPRNSAATWPSSGNSKSKSNGFQHAFKITSNQGLSRRSSAVSAKLLEQWLSPDGRL
jgi:hypothetical protein